MAESIGLCTVLQSLKERSMSFANVIHSPRKQYL